MKCTFAESAKHLRKLNEDYVVLLYGVNKLWTFFALLTHGISGNT